MGSSSKRHPRLNDGKPSKEHQVLQIAIDFSSQDIQKTGQAEQQQETERRILDNEQKTAIQQNSSNKMEEELMENYRLEHGTEKEEQDSNSNKTVEGNTDIHRTGQNHLTSEQSNNSNKKEVPVEHNEEQKQKQKHRQGHDRQEHGEDKSEEEQDEDCALEEVDEDSSEDEGGQGINNVGHKIQSPYSAMLRVYKGEEKEDGMEQEENENNLEIADDLEIEEGLEVVENLDSKENNLERAGGVGMYEKAQQIAHLLSPTSNSAIDPKLVNPKSVRNAIQNYAEKLLLLILAKMEKLIDDDKTKLPELIQALQKLEEFRIVERYDRHLADAIKAGKEPRLISRINGLSKPGLLEKQKRRAGELIEMVRDSKNTRSASMKQVLRHFGHKAE